MTVCCINVFVVIASEVVTLTSSLFSTSNQREMPGRLWTRVSVVLSTHRLCINAHLQELADGYKIKRKKNPYPCLMQTCTPSQAAGLHANVITDTRFEENMKSISSAKHPLLGIGHMSCLISHIIIHVPPLTPSASMLDNMPAPHKVILTVNYGKVQYALQAINIIDSHYSRAPIILFTLCCKHVVKPQGWTNIFYVQHL